jgi:polysaccharide pyruvyl transferase CsaB
LCRVVISGYYGYDNAGDEAILQSMVSELRSVYSDIDIVVLSVNPSKTSKKHKVTAIKRSNLFQIYSAIKKCDILISGGGSLLQDATSFFSPWYYSSIIMIAQILRKPVYAFAQGIGPINRGFNKKLLKYVMNRVFGISVRDKRSKKELVKLGITKEISCTIDPAFLIEPVPKDKSLNILSTESGNKKLTKPRIGFSIRTWKGGIDVVGIIADVADRVSREFDADIILFPLYYKDDLKLAEEIADKMDRKAIVIRGSYIPAELIGLYGIMDINVCIRFHGLVFSAMTGVPMVAISYDPKIDSFMEYLGINNIIRYNGMNAQMIYNDIKIKWKNRAEISKHICGMSDDFKDLARQGIGDVVNLIRLVKEKEGK